MAINRSIDQCATPSHQPNPPRMCTLRGHALFRSANTVEGQELNPTSRIFLPCVKLDFINDGESCSSNAYCSIFLSF